MSGRFSRTLLALGGMGLCLHLFAAGEGIATDPADLTQEITLRCMYEMGEFGEAGMQVCMQSDLDAVEALRTYPPEAQNVIARCVEAQWTRGYAMVQQCVDRALQQSK